MGTDSLLTPGTELEGVLPPSFRGKYVTMVEGEGHLLWDDQGNEYIDAVSSSKNANIGHGVSEIADAAAEQMKTLEYINTKYANEPAKAFTSKINEFTPDGFQHSFLASSGSEAIESAVQMARQYHLFRGDERKYKVISCRRSCHGSTSMALNLTGWPRVKSAMDPLYLDFPKAPNASPYRCEFCGGDGGRECGVRCANAVEQLIKDEGAENVAAFIAEPVGGDANPGGRPHDGYFERIREICDEYDVLFMVDEVITGFGRTGSNFAIEQRDVRPDLIVSGKGMSGGYTPLGGVMAHERITDEFVDHGIGFAYGHTSSFSPTSTAVGLAVLEYIQENGLVENARRVGEYLGERLTDLYEHDIVGDVRGTGMLYGVEFVKDRETKERLDVPSAKFEKAFHLAGLNNGIITSPVGSDHGDFILVAPPLIIDETAVDETVEQLDLTIEATRQFLEI